MNKRSRDIAVELARIEAEAHIAQRSRGEGSETRLVAQGLGPTYKRNVYIRLPRDCNGMKRAYVVSVVDVMYFPPLEDPNSLDERMKSELFGYSEDLEGAMHHVAAFLRRIP